MSFINAWKKKQDLETKGQWSFFLVFQRLRDLFRCFDRAILKNPMLDFMSWFRALDSVVWLYCIRCISTYSFVAKRNYTIIRVSDSLVPLSEGHVSFAWQVNNTSWSTSPLRRDSPIPAWRLPKPSSQLDVMIVPLVCKSAWSLTCFLYDGLTCMVQDPACKPFTSNWPSGIISVLFLFAVCSALQGEHSTRVGTWLESSPDFKSETATQTQKHMI